jgi:hypothetical protein
MYLIRTPPLFPDIRDSVTILPSLSPVEESIRTIPKEKGNLYCPNALSRALFPKEIP